MAVFLNFSNFPVKNNNDLFHETTGTDHWITDLSDFIRFEKEGHLQYLLLSIPSENINLNPSIFSKINLNDEFFVISNSAKFQYNFEETKYRFFDLRRNILFCLKEIPTKNTRFDFKKISANLFLIFDVENYIGFGVCNPLSRLVKNIADVPENIENIENSYVIFNIILNEIENKNFSICDFIDFLKKLKIRAIDLCGDSKILQYFFIEEIAEAIDFLE